MIDEGEGVPAKEIVDKFVIENRTLNEGCAGRDILSETTAEGAPKPGWRFFPKGRSDFSQTFTLIWKMVEQRITLGWVESIRVSGKVEIS